RYANQYNIPIRVRSGGHNYEGYSTADQALIIDVGDLDGIIVDTDNDMVTIQGGVKNTQLYHKLATYGYPFPGGTCPSVAVAGYTLGGGWGYSSRYLGLGCDSLEEIQIVDYRGCLVTANKEANSDLFWASRGAGGGNYGVVVSMTFKLPPKISMVTLFDMYDQNPSKEVQIEFLKLWQNWIQYTSHKINMNAGIYNTEGDGMYIYGRGLYYGSPQEALELLEPFNQIEGMDINYECLPFIKAIDAIEQTYPASEKFKSTGRFVTRTYTTKELEKIISIVNQPRPLGSVLTQIGLYGLGGKVKEIDKQDTAFYHRDANFILSMQSVWEEDRYKEQNIQWVQLMFPSLYQLTEGSYVNFPYAQLSNPEFEYYGENVLRLKSVKRKYDPYNIFNYPQGIAH
ncbi:MAG: FAD-binding oxidoreductase, partial [Turicibacter sp.]